MDTTRDDEEPGGRYRIAKFIQSKVGGIETNVSRKHKQVKIYGEGAYTN
jgi:hypothetical protein